MGRLALKCLLLMFPKMSLMRPVKPATVTLHFLVFVTEFQQRWWTGKAPQKRVFSFSTGKMLDLSAYLTSQQIYWARSLKRSWDFSALEIWWDCFTLLFRWVPDWEALNPTKVYIHKTIRNYRCFCTEIIPYRFAYFLNSVTQPACFFFTSAISKWSGR